ncbi:hypothetical protein ASB58_10990 [Pseudomonas abyssi]|uniref:Uncharacterized protein n=1 Tax=Pseudomonas abyssi TaxID=170540 RepID=A0A395R2S7_9PSED|nr:hypothetical protein ASB58_10990 [Halopseudomonas gallaeciensis]
MQFVLIRQCGICRRLGVSLDTEKHGDAVRFTAQALVLAIEYGVDGGCFEFVFLRPLLDGNTLGDQPLAGGLADLLCWVWVMHSVQIRAISCEDSARMMHESAHVNRRDERNCII